MDLYDNNKDSYALVPYDSLVSVCSDKPHKSNRIVSRVLQSVVLMGYKQRPYIWYKSMFVKKDQKRKIILKNLIVRNVSFRMCTSRVHYS